MFGALADVHIARCTELAARLDGKSFVVSGGSVCEVVAAEL